MNGRGEPQPDPRKVRIGLAMIGAAFAISVGLLIAVDDAVGRFVFAFVALVSVVQLWRLRRRYSSA